MENILTLETLTPKNEIVEVDFNNTIIKVKRQIPLIEKNNLANMIVEASYGVKKDKDGNIIKYEMRRDLNKYSFLLLGLIAKHYLVDMKFPMVKGEIDLISVSVLMDSTGLYEVLVDEITDIRDFVYLTNSYVEEFKSFIENKLKVASFNKMNETIVLFNELNMEQLKNQRLQNEELLKTIELMPKDADGIREQVETINDSIDKLKSSELYDTMSKVGLK